MRRVIVVGAGPMGLAAAYHATKLGHPVVVLEATAEPEDWPGISISTAFQLNDKVRNERMDWLNEQKCDRGRREANDRVSSERKRAQSARLNRLPSA